jgi:ferredoxin
MTVTLHIQTPDWTLIADIPWEDRQSIAQLAKNNGIDFPVSCGIWACGICKCKIIAWNQYIQIDKISMPMRSLERSEDWTFQEVFACVGGITSEAINDTEHHEIILEKNM